MDVIIIMFLIVYVFFYCGGAAGLSVEELAVTGLDISSIPEKEQVRIINKELEKLGLTKDERSVFLAVNGNGYAACGA